MGQFSGMANAASPAPQGKKPYGGGGWNKGGGGSAKEPFDPRMTEKDFVMANMNAQKTAEVVLQLQQMLGQLAADADVPALVEELRERFYAGLIAKSKDMERGIPAGVVNAGSSAPTKAPAGEQTAEQAAKFVADATGGEAGPAYPSEWNAFPNAQEIWPLGKFSAAKRGGNGLTLVESLAEDGGPGYFLWFIQSTQKSEANRTFQKKVGAFMDAAAEAGIEFKDDKD